MKQKVYNFRLPQDRSKNNVVNLLPDDRFVVRNIGYWVVYEQIGPTEWHCVYLAQDKEDGERWVSMQPSRG